MRYSGLAALAMTLVLWSCDKAGEVAPLTGPKAAQHDVVGSSNGQGYVVAKEKDPTVGTIAAVIGSQGGKLVLGDYTLLIPSGTVAAPTTFSMTKISGELAVSLSATQVLPNDVGSAGFSQPVSLTLSYQNAASMPSNEQDLRILWLKADGTTEAQSSTVDVVGKKVTGKLYHFSDYGIGFPGTTTGGLLGGSGDGLLGIL